MPSLLRTPAVLGALVIVSGGWMPGCASAPKRPPASPERDHAFITYSPDEAKSGRLRLAVKDLIDVRGVVTTAGSEFLAKHSRPAKRDAACLAIARRRHVALVGKTNLSEFAVRVTGINPYYGTPVNPLSSRHLLIPGGSSSGSAVAVADDLADVAFGTDTCGSIRVPAACCGVFGLKTTLGLVSLKGVFPIDPQNLDTVGPMAKDVKRLVQGMDLLQEGFTAKYRAAVAAKPQARSITIGRLYIAGTDQKIDQAVDAALARTGFKVVTLDSGFRDQWKAADADAAADGAIGAWIYDQQFGKEPEVNAICKAIFTLGRIDYLTRFRELMTRRDPWRRALASELKGVDMIALPTLKKFPPRMPKDNGTALLEAEFLATQNTAAVNFGGAPAVAIPVASGDRDVPMTSLELVGRRLGEAQLLNAARLVEARGEG